MQSVKRLGTALAAAALVSLASGCFGSYGLVRKVHAFNSEVHSNKWAQEGVFLALNFPFVPVYGIACILDSVFFNAVEFWTGEQLVATDSAPAPKAGQTAQPAPAPAKPTPAPRKAARPR